MNGKWMLFQCLNLFWTNWDRIWYFGRFDKQFAILSYFTLNFAFPQKRTFLILTIFFQCFIIIYRIWRAVIYLAPLINCKGKWKHNRYWTLFYWVSCSKGKKLKPRERHTQIFVNIARLCFFFLLTLFEKVPVTW